ncbi:unnamed protein product [Prunus armeniaca]|uniref:Protein kinase domain-containing protein n=1 Tax=Prunus armeniaca TaxID=36596 RepID=A0A6J5X214_PRUAR|nr:unnamed protein product [Prunus armeniaca]
MAAHTREREEFYAKCERVGRRDGDVMGFGWAEEAAAQRVLAALGGSRRVWAVLGGSRRVKAALGRFVHVGSAGVTRPDRPGLDLILFAPPQEKQNQVEIELARKKGEPFSGETFVKLHFRNNSFHGTLHQELARLSRLQLINFGFNNFMGTIPVWFGSLSKLEAFNIFGNQFFRFHACCNLQLICTAKIPNEIGTLDQVEFMYVQDNALKGHVLNLGNNQFGGPLPSKLWQCEELLELVLENNNFSGSIPKNMGNLTQLMEIYIAYNNLTGTISDEIGDLQNLQTPRREIPTGGPFQNLSSESFVSNSALCGAAQLHVPPCKNNTQKPNSRKASSSNLKYLIPGIISTNLLVASVLLLILQRKRKVEVATETALLPQLLWRTVSHLELLRATNGFHESNLLGSGGFGSVYKGTISDGIDVAVKVFNLQIEGAFKSFDSECDVLSNIRHRNLIKSVVAVNLISKPWYYNTCLMEALRSGCNILLDDDDMVAHVADFGIARLLGEGDSMTQTMTLATIRDVYSFGIVLMETFTRRKPTDEMFVGEMNLKQWIANSLLPDAAIVEVVDADLLGAEEHGDFVSRRDCLSSIMRLALACCAQLPKERINMQEALVTPNKIKIKFMQTFCIKSTLWLLEDINCL